MAEVGGEKAHCQKGAAFGCGAPNRTTRQLSQNSRQLGGTDANLEVAQLAHRITHLVKSCRSLELGGMNGPSIPEHGDALTVDWPERALSTSGGFASIKDIAVEDNGAGSGALGSILRCTLTYYDEEPETPKSVVVKLSSSDKTSLRIAKLLSMYKREYFCFRQLESGIPLGLPKLLYGDFDNASHRFVTVLEDLGYMERMDQIIGADGERDLQAGAGGVSLSETDIVELIAILIE